jgi:hypothetical protein
MTTKHLVCIGGLEITIREEGASGARDDGRKYLVLEADSKLSATPENRRQMQRIVDALRAVQTEDERYDEVETRRMRSRNR